MKKQIIVILAALAVLCVSFPAYAGNWRTVLEKDLIEKNQIARAMEMAEIEGVSQEEFYLAVVDIEKLYTVDPCVACTCCMDNSPSTICGEGVEKECVENSCCNTPQ